MKKLFLFFLFLFGYGTVTLQSQETYHDPALDTIANNVAVMDSDMNGWNIAKNNLAQGLTLGQTVTNQMMIATNQNAGGSGSATNAQAQGMASGLSSSNALMTAFGGIPAALGTGGLAPQSGTNLISSAWDLGTFNGVDYHIDLGLKTGNLLPISWISTIRALIYGIFCAMCFQWSLEAIKKDVLGTLGQRQVTGTQQEFMGFNASAITSPIFAGIITAAVATLFPILLASSVITAGAASMHSLSQSLNGSGALAVQAWDVLTAFVPVGEIAIQWINYVFFRYIFMFPLFLFVRSVILWLSA